MSNESVTEKAKAICQDSRAAAFMWVRVFEIKVEQCGNGYRDFESCRDFADLAIVEAYDRGGTFRSTP